MESRAERERRLSRARVERHRQAETDIRRQGRREDDRRRQGVLRQQETDVRRSLRVADLRQRAAERLALESADQRFVYAEFFFFLLR